MAKVKHNFKANAKKSLAVLSAVALLVSCGTTGLFTVSAAETDKKVSSATVSNPGTKMFIYDENGNDITDSPIIYLDNSSAAGQATSAQITVKMSNDKGTMNDSILVSLPSSNDHFSAAYSSSSYNAKTNEATSTVSINACDYILKEVSDPITGEPHNTLVEDPYKPGRNKITFFAKNGEIQRQLDVVVLEPATDMKVYWGNSTTPLDLNDAASDSNDTTEDSSVMNNEDAMSIIANHPVTLSAAFVSPTSNCTDEVEWSVYDGFFNQKNIDAGEEILPTTKAKISENGYFTPVENGMVTIVANCKSTPRATREYEMAQKNYQSGKTKTKPVFVSDRQDAIGTKSRSIRNVLTNKILDNFYTLGYDVNGNLLYDNDNPITNLKSDKRAIMNANGDFMVKQFTVYPSKPVVREVDEKTGMVSYRENDSGSIMPITLYKPVYIDMKTIPKFIHVYIIKENPAIRMSFSKTTNAMEIGEKFQLELDVVPTHSSVGYESGATDIYTWTSSNPEIASVDQNGVVTANKKGDVTITATAENDKVFTSCNITVLTKAQSISISPSPTSTRVGNTIELTATMNPIDANDEIIWESADPKIASVTPIKDGPLSNPQKALVTGKSKGFTEIIARAKNSGAEAARCRVNVEDKILSDSLVLSTNNGEKITPVAENGTLSVYTGQEINIDAQLTATDGRTPDDQVLWKIENNSNDYVTESAKSSTNLRLMGNAEGKVKITAYSEANPNKVKKVFYVEVLKKCDYITIYDSREREMSGTKNMNVNSKLNLSAQLTIKGNYPLNHKDKVKSWTSSDPTVATVDEKGVVTALSVGEAEITVTTSSDQTKSFYVNVFITSSVSLSGVEKSTDGKSLPTASVEIGRTKWLDVTVMNQDSSVSGVDCVWTSSDENVATVSYEGEITAKNVGTTVITVKSGAQSESCLLTVTASVRDVVYDEIPAYTYDPTVKAYMPKPKLTLENGTVLVENKDYTVEYEDNTEVGWAKMHITGIGYYDDSDITIEFQIAAKQLADSDIEISRIALQKCTGEDIEPAFTISYNDVELELNKDYEVSYKNNSSPSTEEQPAQIVIEGIGNYTGEVVQTFYIYCNHDQLEDTEVVKEPTYQETGLVEGRCTVCGEKVTKALPIKNFLGIYGDVDNSGKIDSGDALQILRKSVQLVEFDELQMKLGDVDGDGKITSADSLLVLRKSVGYEDSNSVAGQDYN